MAWKDPQAIEGELSDPPHPASVVLTLFGLRSHLVILRGGEHLCLVESSSFEGFT